MCSTKHLNDIYKAFMVCRPYTKNIPTIKIQISLVNKYRCYNLEGVLSQDRVILFLSLISY